jgi:hypothetical protein
LPLQRRKTRKTVSAAAAVEAVEAAVTEEARVEGVARLALAVVGLVA